MRRNKRLTTIMTYIDNVDNMNTNAIQIPQYIINKWPDELHGYSFTHTCHEILDLFDNNAYHKNGSYRPTIFICHVPIKLDAIYSAPLTRLWYNQNRTITKLSLRDQTTEKIYHINPSKHFIFYKIIDNITYYVENQTGKVTISQENLLNLAGITPFSLENESVKTKK